MENSSVGFYQFADISLFKNKEWDIHINGRKEGKEMSTYQATFLNEVILEKCEGFSLVENIENATRNLTKTPISFFIQRFKRLI